MLFLLGMQYFQRNVILSSSKLIKIKVLKTKWAINRYMVLRYFEIIHNSIFFVKQTVLIVHFGINIKLLTFINGIKFSYFLFMRRSKRMKTKNKHFKKFSVSQLECHNNQSFMICNTIQCNNFFAMQNIMFLL